MWGDVNTGAVVWELETLNSLHQKAIVGRGVSISGASDRNVPALLLPEQARVGQSQGFATCHRSGPSTWLSPTTEEVLSAAKSRQEDLAEQQRVCDARKAQLQPEASKVKAPIQPETEVEAAPASPDGEAMPEPLPGQTVAMIVAARRATKEGSAPGGPSEVMRGKEGDSMEARTEVFRDLWRRGYWLTDGMKFGADFLLYPGNPESYHAEAVVVVQPHSSTRLSGLELVGLVRLATAVRKKVLIASCCETHSEEKVEEPSIGPPLCITYHTVEFEGVTQRGWTAAHAMEQGQSRKGSEKRAHKRKHGKGN